MVSECFESLIERPSGISGYRPASWCAVCGRTVSSQAVKRCNTQGCPNLSHAVCLGEETEYRCGNTGQLRVNAGINDPVSPCVTLPAHPTTPPTDEESEDDLDDLRREELKQLVKNLRRDLTSTKKQLNNHKNIQKYLVDRRRALVEELNTVDTLLATLTFEESQQRSVACSARPHNIIGECEAVTRPPSEDSSTQHSRSSTPTRLSSPPPSPSPPASTQHTLPEESESSPPREDTTDSAANNESGTERQHSSQQSSQGASGQRRLPKKKKRPASRGNTSQPGHQPRQEAVGPRLQQARCPHCRRHGHTQEQCPRKTCDYCQGRSHSSLHCRVRIADERQKELVQAVRQTSQETLLALRGVAWQLQQPAAQQRVGPTLVAPPGPLASRSAWPLTQHPAPAIQYGAAPQHFPAMLHSYQ